MENKIREVIILMSELRPQLNGGIPTPLTQVNQETFLDFIFKLLEKNGIIHAVLDGGYQLEIIQKKFGQKWKNIDISYSIEEKSLGTGGGIKKAFNLIKGDTAFVLNGDTLFDINFLVLENFHFQQKSNFTIALKKLDNPSNSKIIQLSKNNQILSFDEKLNEENSLMSGGIYVINKNTVESFEENKNFSIEKDYLEKDTESKIIFGKIFNNYFVDIAIPSDFQQFIAKVKAKNKNIPFEDLKFDKTWTLFLDRDGVFNHQIIGDYVKQVHELKIIDGVPEAIAKFTTIFGRIVVVTNQQGIGKGLMTEKDLNHLHGFINNLIESSGGKIDHFYFAPQIAGTDTNYRKSGTGMGLHAQFDFPEIDFEKSLIIGDSESDIEFGTKLGMKTIMLKNNRNLSTNANYIFENLYDVSKTIKI